ncbi:methyltransferase [Candidatus Woesearchaeota archaeon]|nr:methyltransferase [Candidatus Woesearchaeota archaeon]
MVYAPREDSEFLRKFVVEHARGKVLDMGTGSGVQARAAKENPKVTEVLAVDINDEALEQKDLETRKSNMFSNIEEKFDTIICNPPYLPNEKNDEDAALYGGKNGWEWSIKFLKEAKKHLNPDGNILFLFSSLTNKEMIDNELRNLKYHHEELGMLAMFMERLYVYRIWRSDGSD